MKIFCENTIKKWGILRFWGDLMKDEHKKYWKVILTGALITGTGIGIFSNCMGVFIEPVCSDLGFSRGTFTLIGTISIASSMLVIIWFGKLLQSIPIKRILLICAMVCSCVPLGYSFCTVLWQFYILAFLNGLAVNGITMLTVGVLIERQLKYNKGMAMGASFAGVGIFSSAMLPILQITISNFGWRWGFRLESAVGFSVLLPTILFLVNSDMGTNVKTKITQPDGQVCAAVVRTLSFRLLFIGLFCANFVNLSLYNHAIPYLTDIGFEPLSATMVSSTATLLMMFTKPLFGIALDKFGLRAGTLILSSVLLGGAFMALALPTWSGFSFFYSVLLAGCSCANSIPANVFAANLYGKQDYAQIVARLTLAASAGAAIGTPLAGFLFDNLGSYQLAWISCAFLSLLSGATLFGAIKTKRKLNK